MGVLTLSSNNPQLSFIISKNPASGPSERKLREGKVTGKYGPAGADTYHISFQDSYFKNSYSEGFDYLNASQYFSPIMYQNMLEEFFKTLRNQGHKDDGEGQYSHSLTFTMLALKAKTAIFRHLQTYPDFTVEYQDLLGGRYHRVVIRSQRSLQNLLQFAFIFLLLAAFNNEDHYHIEKSLMEKLFRQLQALKLDYYVRYYIASRLLQNRKEFAKYQPLLEEHPTRQMKMFHGSTQQQRKDWIVSHLEPKGMDILEVGCGAGYYALAFAKKFGTHSYYAVDTNPDELATVRRKAVKKELDNIVTYDSFEQWYKADESLKYVPGSGAAPLTILLTEVLEHMPAANSLTLLTEILQSVQWSRVIITMPNREFNVFYGLGEAFRHDDHHYEPTRAEFQELVTTALQKALPDYRGKAQYCPVGDQVDGLSVSHGWVAVRSPVV
jgi:SAM-dependent methyltransferase